MKFLDVMKKFDRAVVLENKKLMSVYNTLLREAEEVMDEDELAGLDDKVEVTETEDEEDVKPVKEDGPVSADKFFDNEEEDLPEGEDEEEIPETEEEDLPEGEDEEEIPEAEHDAARFFADSEDEVVPEGEDEEEIPETEEKPVDEDDEMIPFSDFIANEGEDEEIPEGEEDAEGEDTEDEEDSEVEDVEVEDVEDEEITEGEDDTKDDKEDLTEGEDDTEDKEAPSSVNESIKKFVRKNRKLFM